MLAILIGNFNQTTTIEKNSMLKELSQSNHNRLQKITEWQYAKTFLNQTTTMRIKSLLEIFRMQRTFLNQTTTNTQTGRFFFMQK